MNSAANFVFTAKKDWSPSRGSGATVGLICSNVGAVNLQFFGLRRDRVFKALVDNPQLNFPSCSRVETKLINTDTLVKFPYYKSVRMVGRECLYGR